MVFRERQGDGGWKHDYLLANAPLATPSAEFARVSGRASTGSKNVSGFAKGEGRLGGLSSADVGGLASSPDLKRCLATWFLAREARRGKNTDPRFDGPTAVRLLLAGILNQASCTVSGRPTSAARCGAPFAAERRSPASTTGANATAYRHDGLTNDRNGHSKVKKDSLFRPPYPDLGGGRRAPFVEHSSRRAVQTALREVSEFRLRTKFKRCRLWWETRLRIFQTSSPLTFPLTIFRRSWRRCNRQKKIISSLCLPCMGWAPCGLR